MSLEDSGLVIKVITQTIESETKECMLLGKLGVSLLRNILAGKGVKRTSKGVNRAGKGVNR